MEFHTGHTFEIRGHEVEPDDLFPQGQTTGLHDGSHFHAEILPTGSAMIQHWVVIRDWLDFGRGTMRTGSALGPSDRFKPRPRYGFIGKSVNQFDQADSVSVVFS